ncbi:MAG: nucleoside triphosphate pyrophosphohydrolase [Anaerolineae bacterium]|nr:nucleoside triphosphate pyrophosphohydrolase [Anaerolineae bacterium]
MTITIVGLGPGDPGMLTRRAWETLSTAGAVYLRTARHPTVDTLPGAITGHSFDSLYEEADDFASLYEAIARRIVELGRRPEGVVYAVPGHPLVGEATVARIRALAEVDGIPVEIVPGLSFIEPVLDALNLDGLGGLQVLDAVEVAALHHPPINPDAPALLAQLYSQAVASDTKLVLMNQYPEEHPVALVHGAGTPGVIVEHVPLYEIDRSPHLAHLTTLYVAPLARTGSFEAFQETVAHLRDPEHGCPWDAKQTHQSLRRTLLEETYEVLEAIDAGDPAAMREEFGDLLLQIVLHSQIATDEGEWRMADVIADINEKIIRRHPHVWGDTTVNDSEDVKVNWEQIKKKEREDKGNDKVSVLDGVPMAVPALYQAFRYQERAGHVGFDWEKIEDVLAKVREELAEVEAAGSPEALQAEVGDLLFAVVNWARWLGVLPESALRETNQRFRRRFQYIEEAARRQRRSVNELSLAEMDALWEEAKAALS